MRIPSTNLTLPVPSSEIAPCPVRPGRLNVFYFTNPLPPPPGLSVVLPWLRCGQKHARNHRSNTDETAEFACCVAYRQSIPLSPFIFSLLASVYCIQASVDEPNQALLSYSLPTITTTHHCICDEGRPAAAHNVFKRLPGRVRAGNINASQWYSRPNAILLKKSRLLPTSPPAGPSPNDLDLWRPF